MPRDVMYDEEKDNTMLRDKVRFKPAVLGGAYHSSVGLGGTNVSSTQQPSKILYVARNGDDTTGDGSFYKPYYTIGKAVTIALATVTVSNPILIQVYSAKGGSAYAESAPIQITAGGLSIAGIGDGQVKLNGTFTVDMAANDTFNVSNIEIKCPSSVAFNAEPASIYVKNATAQIITVNNCYLNSLSLSSRRCVYFINTTTVAKITIVDSLLETGDVTTSGIAIQMNSGNIDCFNCTIVDKYVFAGNNDGVSCSLNRLSISNFYACYIVGRIGLEASAVVATKASFYFGTYIDGGQYPAIAISYVSQKVYIYDAVLLSNGGQVIGGTGTVYLGKVSNLNATDFSVGIIKNYFLSDIKNRYLGNSFNWATSDPVSDNEAINRLADAVNILLGGTGIP